MRSGWSLAPSLAVLLLASSAAASSIYWTDAKELGGGAGLYRAPAAGGPATQLVPGTSSTGIAYDATSRKIYWAQRTGDTKILRADLDGSDVETVIDNDVDMRGIAVDPLGGKLYWTNGITTIMRANLDGSDAETIFLGAPDQITWDLAVDPVGGKLYWTTLDRDTIRRSNLDGSNVEDIVTGLGRPFGLALDLAGGHVYWGATEAEKIQRASLDGSNVEDVVLGAAALLGIRGLSIDSTGGKLYWGDSTADAIKRANLDGTDIEVVVSGLSSPWDVVFVPEPSGALLLAASLAALARRRAGP